MSKVFIVYKDGTYKEVDSKDARTYENDPDWERTTTEEPHNPLTSRRKKMIEEAARDLFDNRLRWSDGRNPYAPREFWRKLGAALYGESDKRVIELSQPPIQTDVCQCDPASFGSLAGPDHKQRCTCCGKIRTGFGKRENVVGP